MSQPHDQPKHGEDWNDLSAREVEETLEAASELAYQLADDLGSVKEVPHYRDTSELAVIEGTLDVELKQLEHLVDKTRLELDPEPAPEKPAAAASGPVPDFMSEFLADDSIPVAPMASTEGPLGANPGPIAAGLEAEQQKPGLVGVGTLGRTDRRKPANTPRPQPVEIESRESKRFVEQLEIPLYKTCLGIASVLEILDKPFARLSPAIRRALSVTALAAFGVCLVVFLASFLFN